MVRRRSILKTAFSYILIPVIVLMATFVSPVKASPAEPQIRVGILSNQQSVLLSADTDFDIKNADTGQLLKHIHAKDRVTISSVGKTITINSKQSAALHVNIVKLPKKSSTPITVNKNGYRGDISIHITHGKTGLTVVNTLPIEQYLYGVLAKEISPDWHFEAIKAQAVAARTYSMHHMRKHRGDGYDLCVTTDCQVYGGMKNENLRMIKAVNDTYGQVVTYKGKLISTYFHSSSGGYTENSENVWNTSEPYLRGVVDYDQDAPQYKWEKKVTSSELTEALDKAGYHIGMVKAIELVPLEKIPMTATERGVSGRVKIIRFIGTNGNVQLTGEKFRTMLGLKSTLFDISVMVSAPKAVEFVVTDSHGDRSNKKVEINLPLTSQPGFITDKRSMHRISGAANEIIVISGLGWGHGVGLSQWGAKAMAEKGPQGDPTYFKAILKHYYQGTVVKKVY